MRGTVLKVTPSTKQTLRFKGTPQWIAWIGAQRFRPADYRVLRFLIATGTDKIVEVEDRACADNEGIGIGDPVTMVSEKITEGLLYCSVRPDLEALTLA